MITVDKEPLPLGRFDSVYMSPQLPAFYAHHWTIFETFEQFLTRTRTWNMYCLRTTGAVLRRHLSRPYKVLRWQQTSASLISQEPFLSGNSSNYVEDMYASWLQDPSSVHRVRWLWSRSPFVADMVRESWSVRNFSPGTPHVCPPLNWAVLDSLGDRFRRIRIRSSTTNRWWYKPGTLSRS